MNQIIVHVKRGIGEHHDWIPKFIPASLEDEWTDLNKRLSLLGQPYPTLMDYGEFYEKHVLPKPPTA